MDRNFRTCKEKVFAAGDATIGASLVVRAIFQGRNLARSVDSFLRKTSRLETVMSTSMRGIIYAVITAILWGTLAIVLKVSLSDLTPADITWFRFVMAFVVLAVYYYYRKPAYLRILKRPPRFAHHCYPVPGIKLLWLYSGAQLTSPSVAQIFIQLGPVILAISGFAFFHEKISARQIVGLFIVIAGLAIYYREQTHLLSSGGANWSRGWSGSLLQPYPGPCTQSC
ncbi:MAG: EamA family transporter [Chromatiales bacterium]|nr:EamA family transporter [Chromatiales bacterium]